MMSTPTTYPRFCDFVGYCSVDNTPCLHAERQKIGKLLLVMVAITTGRLDQHVEGKWTNRATIYNNTLDDKSRFNSVREKFV